MLKKINLQWLAGEPAAETTPAETADKTAAPAGGADGQQDNPDGKTFTQAELDAAIEKRLAREKKKQLSEDDIKAFQDWKKTQKPADADPATSELQKKLDAATAKLEAAERKETVLNANVKPKMAAYVVFEVSKLVTEKTEFEDALETFLKANPEYATDQTDKPATGAQGQRQAGSPGKMTEVEEAFYRKNPELRPK